MAMADYSARYGGAGKAYAPTSGALAQRAIPAFFYHACLFSSLILQKFGVAVGGGYMPIALPTVILLACWLSIAGYIRVSLPALLLYLGMAALALVSTLWAVSGINRSSTSLPSLILFLLIYLAFIARPKDAPDRQRALGILVGYMRFLAVVGIAQYALQFVGFRFTSFGSLFPFLKPILLEQFYNSNAIVAYGSNVMRSNAVFLREPSTFSQLMCVAMVVEATAVRKYTFLPLYLVSYLVSFSGTGLFSLAAAISINAIFSIKSLVRIPLIIVVAGLCAWLLSIAAPAMMDRYLSRMNEVQSTKSSANARYLAQGKAWNEMLSDETFLTGSGPGSFDRTYNKEGIASNPVLKLTTDYGLITVAFWISLIIVTIWLPNTRLVSLIFLTSLQVGGGTEMNPTFIILMLLICVWTLKEKPRRDIAAAASPRLFASVREVAV
jgi:hypothetical protein